MKNIKTDDDIPNLVAEELRQAQAADIPPIDLPRYVADRIRLRIGGGYDYVRKRTLSPDQRKSEIRQKFTGNNFTELARTYDLSVRRIRQIVNK